MCEVVSRDQDRAAAGQALCGACEWVGVLGVGTVFAPKRREEREKVESD